MTALESVRASATALGPWPGTDPAEATRIIRGELGDPHLPFLPELPDRGVGSDAIGRTGSLLVDLALDVQPHGWRLVDRPGKDARRASSALSTDINILADIAGAEEASATEFKIQVVGPLSLAANLYLHGGERALLDYGARRDIAESLAAGLGVHLNRISTAVPGARVVVQIDEPDIASVMAGTIPTASGYRTLRSISGEEVTGAWRVVIGALKAAGVVETVVSVPEIEAPIERVFAAGADGVAVPLKALTTRQWEHLAGAVEDGKRVWAGVLSTSGPRAQLPRTAELVESIWKPWRQLGLPASGLAGLRVTPSTGLAEYTPSTAKDVLKKLTDVADGLDQLAQG
ncbi:hypothetical protein [Paenarthrobacter aurescens]|uniref:Cobalamin-independent methionine synthase MetE C-terminal/archaeal domain-containing protein n=1 Tax=Paenarthrobacter aurescens TaxID=43663 RepID=A0A4Y3ND10_PAEAU|nr:hypothetical protein [Paenarthrobacter aurescens]MDO6144127.1 hypothetical protein [Paenarthrobacter aurescens]MDO6147974.1 hypothetical protein [Paenarthrobacter aurescens]MDO6159218.1 hypothetical protein [Paenarthrobacter aurescens]MDO6163202.1 hypothetical protein [Paenarthrobacter aurescens]GEB18315.1 hypothetical protein AAU01_10700 [Paenarthrobacter aurescens]